MAAQIDHLHAMKMRELGGSWELAVDLRRQPMGAGMGAGVRAGASAGTASAGALALRGAYDAGHGAEHLMAAESAELAPLGLLPLRGGVDGGGRPLLRSAASDSQLYQRLLQGTAAAPAAGLGARAAAASTAAAAMPAARGLAGSGGCSLDTSSSGEGLRGAAGALDQEPLLRQQGQRGAQRRRNPVGRLVAGAGGLVVGTATAPLRLLRQRSNAATRCASDTFAVEVEEEEEQHQQQHQRRLSVLGALVKQGSGPLAANDGTPLAVAGAYARLSWEEPPDSQATPTGADIPQPAGDDSRDAEEPGPSSGGTADAAPAAAPLAGAPGAPADAACKREDAGSSGGGEQLQQHVRIAQLSAPGSPPQPATPPLSSNAAAPLSVFALHSAQDPGGQAGSCPGTLPLDMPLGTPGPSPRELRHASSGGDSWSDACGGGDMRRAYSMFDMVSLSHCISLRQQQQPRPVTSSSGGGGSDAPGATGAAAGGAAGAAAQPAEPYRLRVVAHSLGGASMLMYLIMRHKAGAAHHVRRLVLLSPAGYHLTYPAAFVPPIYGVPALIWLISFVWPRYAFGVFLPTWIVRLLAFKFALDAGKMPALAALVRHTCECRPQPTPTPRAAAARAQPPPAVHAR